MHPLLLLRLMSEADLPPSRYKDFAGLSRLVTNASIKTNRSQTSPEPVNGPGVLSGV